MKHGFVTSWENVLFTLENIGTCVKITWNYFPCPVLHKVKVFIDYAQCLVQLLLLIFTSNLALFIFMKDSKAVNYNGSEIIELIHLKYGKRMACRDNFFYRKCGIFPENREKVNNGVEISTWSMQLIASWSYSIFIRSTFPISTVHYVANTAYQV